MVATNSKMNHSEIKLAEKTETKQKEEEKKEPKAIATPIVAGEKSKNVKYVDSEELDENSKPKKVPVPKGYVASPVAAERYINGVTPEGEDRISRRICNL